MRAPRPPPHLHAASPRAPPARDGGRAAVVAGSFPVSPGAAAPAPPARCKHTPREGRGGAAPWQPRPEEEARGSGAAIFGGGSGRLPSGTPPLTLSIVCVVTVKPWWLVVAIKEKHRHVEFSFLCTALRQSSGTIIRVDRRVLLLANGLVQQMTAKQTTKRAIISSNDSWKWRIK